MSIWSVEWEYVLNNNIQYCEINVSITTIIIIIMYVTHKLLYILLYYRLSPDIKF